MRQLGLFLALAASLAQPAMGQDRLPNGRHIGAYGSGGNPFLQRGAGVAPVFRTDAGQQPSLLAPQTPPPLPAVPKWAVTLPKTEHSAQFQQYQQYQQQQRQQQQVLQPIQQSLQLVQPGQKFTYNAESPADVESTPAHTLKEIERILDYRPTELERRDYVSWYLNGAHVDPAQFLRAGAGWPEDAFRHFMADYIVAFWNVTMQDAILRLLMPLILVAMVVKVGSMLMDQLLRAEAPTG